jgi:cytochrome c-type biogenesis protein CcmH/NrfG
MTSEEKTFEQLGLVYEALGRYAEASAALDHAAGLDPTRLPTLLALGRVPVLRREFDDAGIVFSRAVALAPGNPTRTSGSARAVPDRTEGRGRERVAAGDHGGA